MRGEFARTKSRSVTPAALLGLLAALLAACDDPVRPAPPVEEAGPPDLEIAPAANGVTLTIRSLGTLEGRRSRAADINDVAQVVGDAGHAFLWTAQSGMKDLGTLGGSETSRANGINSLGQVVGESETATGRSHAFLWTAQGGMVDLGTLGGSGTSVADAIDLQGKVVGMSVTLAGVSHAFLWTAQGGMVDLGTLGGCCSQAYGISEQGEVVGQSATASGVSHAFLWTAQLGMVDIGAVIGSTTLANGINDRGQLVGFVEGGFPFVRALLWTIVTGTVTPLEQRLLDLENRLLQLIRTAPKNPTRQLSMLSANDAVVAALDALREESPHRPLAAEHLGAAVAELDAALAQGLIDATRATTLRNQLAGVVRELAKAAIEAAVARRGDPADIAAARAARDSGDARRAAGDFSGAVQLYRQAIALADGA